MVLPPYGACRVATPAPDDEPQILSLLNESNRQLFVLGLRVLFGIALTVVLLQPLLAPDQVRRSAALLLMAVTTATALWFARRDRMEAAVKTVLFGGWAVVTGSAVLNGGVFSASLFAYPLIIAVGGWVFGLRMAALLGGMTVLAEGALALAGWQGLIHQTPAPQQWQWLVHAMLVIATVSFVGFSIRAYEDRLTQIRRLSRELGDKVSEIEEREAALARQTLQYRTLLDAQADAGLGMFIIRNGRIVYANPAITRIYGYTEAEVLALPSYIQLTHPDDRERVAANHLRRVRGETFENRYDISILTKDGRRRGVETTIAVIPDDPVASVLVIVADITERKHAADELKRSESKFAQVFHASPIAISITRVRDGLCVDINDTYLRQFGWTRDEVIGRSMVEIGLWPSPEARQRWIDRFRADGGHTRDYEHVLLTKTGVPRTVLASSEVVQINDEEHVLVYVNDITERRRTEQSLRQSEERFRRVFRASPAATIISRVSDGAYLDVNEAFTTLFGWRRDEALGTTALRIGIWPDAHERQRWIETLQREGSVRDFETDLLTHDRTLRRCIVSAEFLDIGEERCVISLIHDITDRQRAEREIRELNADLEERVQRRTTELTEANHELESFAYSISHDLRAPLRGIDGFSRLLQEEYGAQLDEQGREYLARVRRASQRMGTLIDDLLELSRVTRQEMHGETVDLSAIAGEIVANLRLEAPARQVEVLIEPDCQAVGDPQLLRVLLENLIGNAWKYTGRTEGARIAFGREKVGVGDTATTSFYVRDNGAGFDMAYADKLFSPFQRLHSPHEFEGSGIGLASAWRVVRRHGGRIWADAAPGQGATFRFTLALGGGLRNIAMHQ